MPTIISNQNNNSFNANLFFKQLENASNDKLSLVMYNAYIKSIIGYNATSIDTLIDGLSDSMKDALVADDRSVDPSIVTIDDLKNKLKNIPKYNGVFRKLHAMKFAPKKKEYLDIAGFKKPKVIIQEGRDFTIITETVNKDDSKNIGVIIKDHSKDIKIEDSLNTKAKYMGGGDIYYEKYLKYKNKYLRLKNQIGGALPTGRKLTYYNPRPAVRSITGYNLAIGNATITRSFAQKVLDNTIKHEIKYTSNTIRKIMFIIKTNEFGFIRGTNRQTLMADGCPYIHLVEPLPENVTHIHDNERLAVHITDCGSNSILLSELLHEMGLDNLNYENFFIKVRRNNPQSSLIELWEEPYDWHWDYE